MKRCTRCGICRPVADFTRQATSADGFGVYCKACRYEYRKQWESENRQHKRAYQNEWIAKNRPRVNESARNRRLRNLDLYKQRMREAMARGQREMRDWYAAALLGVPNSPEFKPLIEAKRNHVLVKRAIKEKST
jgi:hypothetical protein